MATIIIIIIIIIIVIKLPTYQASNFVKGFVQPNNNVTTNVYLCFY